MNGGWMRDEAEALRGPLGALAEGDPAALLSVGVVAALLGEELMGHCMAHEVRTWNPDPRLTYLEALRRLGRAEPEDPKEAARGQRRVATSLLAAVTDGFRMTLT